MKLHNTFILTLILSFTAFGQTPSPTPITAQTEENWQTFTPSWDEFSIEVPELPVTRNFNFSTENITAKRAYRISVNGIYYFMFSDPLKSPDQNNMALGFAGASADPKQDNVVFKFADEWGYHHRLLTVRTPNRTYTFQTVSENENAPPLARFFGGLKIGDQPLKLEEKVLKATRSDNAPVKSQPAAVQGANDKPISANGISGVPNPDTPKAQTSPLRILAKPASAYTEYARLYQIEGIVRLRVIFLANGTIGSVTPAAKLPFGLTEQAIIAARQLRFEPAIQEGVPQSKALTVEYKFTIY